MVNSRGIQKTMDERKESYSMNRKQIKKIKYKGNAT